MIKEVDLIQYLPPIIQEYNEMQRITMAENPEFQLLWDMDENIRKQLYVITATDQGLKRFEKLLGLFPSSEDTTELRRRRILSKWNEFPPYTLTQLNNMLTILCGADGFSTEVQNETYTLTVKVNLVAKSNFDDVNTLLKRIVPANMVIVLELKYNTWQELKAFTWCDLKEKTWREIKEEVL
jgi:hypothetical protein